MSASPLAEMDRLMGSDQVAALRREIERLQQWKAEAIQVIGRWEQCYDVLDKAGHPAHPGEFKSDHVRRWIEQAVA